MFPDDDEILFDREFFICRTRGERSQRDDDNTLNVH
jgi:hypothetical protein